MRLFSIAREGEGEGEGENHDSHESVVKIERLLSFHKESKWSRI